MKTASFIALFLLAVSAAAVTNELQTWTSVAGTTMEARFVKKKSGLVYLETPDGNVKQIKLSNLSKQDRQRVNELTDPFAAKKAERAKAEAERPKASEGIKELFDKTLRNSEEDKVSVDTLGGKTIGIYFSAHWCPPCKAFTPKLVDFHNVMTDQGKPFEIVFVSWDKDSDSMYNYMNEMDMPWLALDFDSAQKKALKQMYEVKGIPMLVIINADGELITKNGRGDVSGSGTGAFDKWN